LPAVSFTSSSMAARLALLLIGLVVVLGQQNAFWGCTLYPRVPPGTSTPVVTSGYGAVICQQGEADGVDTVACTFQYYGLTSDIQAAHWHIGNTSFSNGAVTLAFANTPTSGTTGAVDQKFTATAGTFTSFGGMSFDETITMCSTPATPGPGIGTGGYNAGCYFNLHTLNNLNGELNCNGAPVPGTYTYPTNPGVQTIALTGTIGSSGTAIVQQGTLAASVPVQSPAVRVWAYQVIFSLQSALTASHIHKGPGPAPAVGDVEVVFDITGHSNSNGNSGSFVGVTMFGTAAAAAATPRWPVVTSGFDYAVYQNWSYVNVHTTANPNGEIRGNFGGYPVALPASASTLVVGVSAVVTIVLALFA